MKKPSKTAALILPLALSLLLSACSSGGTQNEPFDETEALTSAEETTAADTETSLTQEAAPSDIVSDTESTEQEVLYDDYDDDYQLYSDLNREIGDYMVFSSVSNGGYVARIVLSDIVHTPDEELNAYQAIGSIRFELVDARAGHGLRANKVTTALFAINELQYHMIGSGIWADCADNALEIYKFEYNGNTKYLLRAYLYKGSENGVYSYMSKDLYCARFYICDGDVCAREHTIKPYKIQRDVKGTLYPQNSEGEVKISDTLVYRGENVFYDEKQDTEIAFDPVHGVATYRTGVSA